MQKSCAHCRETFEISIEDREFLAKISVPEPTWCPRCRHLRRHGHINDYIFYSRNCDQCQHSFISIFPANSPYIVFCQECWYAQARDDKKSAREFDFSRPFFAQFDDLMHTAPQLGIIGMNNENSSYCESAANCKNCYLISESSNCEDCYYAYWIQKTKDCLDSAYTHECELCYEVIDCTSCYRLQHGQNCHNCRDSWFLEGCRSCKNCLFCTNLVQKEYYIFNTPYSATDYFQELTKINLGNLAQRKLLQQKFTEFLQTQPQRNLQIEQCENCTGNYIHHAKNCHAVFHCYEAEDCRYGEHIWRGAKNCWDSNTAGRNAELLYETTNSGIDSYNVKFSRYCWGCHDTEYCNQCKNGHDLFGCVSLKPGAQYCILNKQYTPAEYQKMVCQIQEKMRRENEYGEFFPLSISLFGYNTTVSFENFPLERKTVLKNGWKWEESPNRTKASVVSEPIFKNIAEVPDTICTKNLKCNSCGYSYKIIPQELAFYRQENIPLPEFCSFCRQSLRLKLRAPSMLWARKCAKCQKVMQTSLRQNDRKRYTASNVIWKQCIEKCKM